MPLRIRERIPKKYNVTKPRNQPTTETMGMKKTAGSIKPETLQSAAKNARQSGRDLGGRGGWKAPSSTHHDQSPHIDSTMNKNYEDYFFKINRGHNKGSVRPVKHISKAIRGTVYFR